MNKIVLAGFLFFVNIQLIFSQEQLPNLYGHTSNSLSQAIELVSSANQYTGALNLGIPLYNLQTSEIKLPISLSYSGIGVRPDQHPGWVGMNWNLNCGGEITRIIKDLPDDYDNPNKLVTRIRDFPDKILEITFVTPDVATSYYGDELGFYYNNSTVSGFDDSDAQQFFDSHQELKDTESDIYQFNVGGFSGTFYLDVDGKWKVESDRPIKVLLNGFIALPDSLSGEDFESVWNYNGQYHLKTFSGFTIISDDGTHYIFGTLPGASGTEAIEYSIPFMDQFRSEWTAMSWKLSKIITPENKEISFEYEPKHYTCQMGVSFFYDATDDMSCYYYNPYTDPSDHPRYSTLRTYLQEVPNPFIFSSVPGDEKENALRFYSSVSEKLQYTNSLIYPRYGSYDGSLLRPVYLKSIKSPSKTIEFYKSISEELKYDTMIFYRLFPQDNDNNIQEIIRYFYENLYPQILSMQAFLSNPLNILFKSGTYGEMYIQLERDLYNAFHENFASYQSNWPYLKNCSDGNYLKNLLKGLQWYKLDSIKITDNGTDNQITYGLIYNNQGDERLMLERLDKISANNKKLSHRFSYYEGTLPGYCSEKTDHWGFYNNNKSFLTDYRYESFYNNLNLDISQGPDVTTNYALSRNPTDDLNTALIGTLKEVVYPTGGREEFVYEQNTFSKGIDKDVLNTTGGVDKVIGGLRIHEIVDYASNTLEHDYMKTYHYKSTDKLSEISTSQSSGTNNYIIDYYVRKGFEETGNDVADIASTRYLFSSQSFSPLSENYRGYHVTYSQVLEEYEDGSYKVMYYSDYVDFDGETHFDEYNNNAPVYNEYNIPSLSRSLERGKMKKEIYFDAEENPIKEVNYKYERSSDDNVFSLQFEGHVKSCGESTVYYYFAYPYSRPIYSYNMVKKDEINYYKNGLSINSSVSSIFENGLLKETETILSNSDKLKIKYKYVTDYPVPEGTYTDPAKVNLNYSLLPNNIISNPIEVVNIKTINGTEKVIGGQLFEYEANGKLGKVARLDIADGITDYTWSDLNSLTGQFSYDNRYNVRQAYNYDDENNLVKSVSYYKFRDAAQFTSYLWDYNNEYVTAEIVNANKDQVISVNFEENSGWVNRTGFSYSTDLFKTGNVCGKLVGQGVTHDITHSDPISYYDSERSIYDSPKKFKFSAWVYSTTTSAYVALVYQTSQGTYSSPWVHCPETDKWVLVKGEFEVPLTKNGYDVTQLRVGVDNESGSGTIYFDDVRLYPSDAKMTTRTYEPLVGVSSVSEDNNQPIRYEYDNFGRLYRVYDHNDNIVKQYNYHYQGQE